MSTLTRGPVGARAVGRAGPLSLGHNIFSCVGPGVSESTADQDSWIPEAATCDMGMVHVAGPTEISPQGGAMGVTHRCGKWKARSWLLGLLLRRRVTLSRRWLNLLPSLPVGLTRLVMLE